MTTCIFVAGNPVPKGSAKAFMRKGARFPSVVQDNAEKQRPWASLIAYSAMEAGMQMIDSESVSIEIIFTMRRPRSHFGTGKNGSKLKESAPVWHTGKPDLDKLVRCVKDALTGVAWSDDSQVAVVKASKAYGPSPGALITVSKI